MPSDEVRGNERILNDNKFSLIRPICPTEVGIRKHDGGLSSFQENYLPTNELSPIYHVPVSLL